MGGNSIAAEDLLAIAVEVVRPAAARVQRMRAEAVTGAAADRAPEGGIPGGGDAPLHEALQVDTKSTDTDVVTVADRAVEQQMVAALRRARPHDLVLGEEYGTAGEVDEAAVQVRWLLDPIDGSVNYLYGLPWYAVSLAAEVDGQVVAGVVYNAATGHEWRAAAGAGAWREGVRLRGSGQTVLGQALVATGFGYDPARRAHQAGVIAGLLDQVRDIRRFGAASLDLCLAAEGAVDAYFERGLSPWDHAAGGLIAAEAGLTVAGLGGVPPGEQMLVAAPPSLFGALHERLVALDAAGGP